MSDQHLNFLCQHNETLDATEYAESPDTTPHKQTHLGLHYLYMG